MTFFRGNGSAFDMAEYFPLNQGDEWIYLFNVAGIFHSEPSIDYDIDYFLWKNVVTGTEEVNGVETMKMEMGLLNQPPNDFQWYVMDSEGLKLYRNISSGPETDNIYDPPILLFPAQFDLGDVHQGTYSYTSYFGAYGDPILATGTGNNTACLKSIEDVTVRWGGESKDCLRIYFSLTTQTIFPTVTDPPCRSNWTHGLDVTYWFAHNVGVIQGCVSQSWRHPEEGSFTLLYTLKLISATVDGVHYGFPAILGGL